MVWLWKIRHLHKEQNDSAGDAENGVADSSRAEVVDDVDPCSGDAGDVRLLHHLDAEQTADLTF